MAQVSCNRVRIKTGSLDAVHAWARTINTRRVEALATLHDERVQLESVFLEHAADGDFSSTTCEAKTLAKARELAKSSIIPSTSTTSDLCASILIQDPARTIDRSRSLEPPKTLATQTLQIVRFWPMRTFG